MRIQKLSVFVFAVAISGILPFISANAAVWTNQLDYSPGSTVIINGDNSDGAGYLAGETIDVNVAGPYGLVQGNTIAGDNGAFSWQFVLPSDDSAVGYYNYTVTGVQSDVTQSGNFTDKVNTNTTLNAISTPLTNGQVGVAFSGQVTKTSGSIPNGEVVQLRYAATCIRGNSGTLSASTVTSGGTGGFSETFTAPSAGTYQFWAYFVGNSGHNPSSSDCQQITVNAAPTKLDQTITFSSLSDKTYGDTDFNVSATASSYLTVTFTASGNCSVAGTLVHLTGAGSCTITAHQAGDSTYNPAPDVPQSFNIAKNTPIITWANPADITYPTALSGTQLNATANTSGSFVYTPAAGTVLNAGLGQTLHVDFTPTDTTNYNIASKNVAINVLKANAVITITPYSVIYDGNPHTAIGSATGVESPTPVDLTSLLNLSGTTHTNAGNYVGDVWTFAGNSNYNSDTGVITNNINKADATIIVTPYDVTYDGNPHTADASAKGVKGEDLTGFDLTGTNHTNAGIYNGDAWIFTDVTGNYNDASGTVDDNIKKADATINVNGYTGVYDGDAHGASGTATGVKGEDLSSSLDLGPTFTDVPGGTADWTFGGGTNYNPDSGSVAIIIDKADPIIVVTPYDITYDGNPHTAIGSATGVKGESLSGLDLSGTTHTNAGAYTGDIWTFTDITGNYNNVSGTVNDNISKADQTITFTNPGDQIFGSSFTLSASTNSGLAVAFVSNTPLVCTVSGSTTHIIGLVGQICSITASQPGDDNYNAASPITQTFNVLPYGTNTKLPPITITKKDFQKSSTIPVKFTIYNGSTPISWANAKLEISKDGISWTPAVASGGSNILNNFRYDPSGKLYIFNLSTKMSIFNSGNTYTLRITLDDGETITQVINIK